jgi:NOL1/NOP2/fmu family ribosome biogenesis protein
VFFSHVDDLSRWLLRQTREYVSRYYNERGAVDTRATRVTKKPSVQVKPTASKASAGNACYKIVVAYLDGTKHEVAEVLTIGCKNEEVIEVTPEDYEKYMRNETSLSELIEKYIDTITLRKAEQAAKYIAASMRRGGGEDAIKARAERILQTTRQLVTRKHEE